MNIIDSDEKIYESLKLENIDLNIVNNLSTEMDNTKKELVDKIKNLKNELEEVVNKEIQKLQNSCITTLDKPKESEGKVQKVKTKSKQLNSELNSLDNKMKNLETQIQSLKSLLKDKLP